MKATLGQRFREADEALLRRMLERTGVAMEPAEFVVAVQRAFLDARPPSAGGHLIVGFRECPSFEDFRGALAQASERSPVQASVLVIGAGNDVPGRDSEYAATVAREVLGAGARIARLDLEPETIYGIAPGTFDLVVTHSLAHYFLDQEGFCRFIRLCTGRHGSYVMGNEPNRRFWANQEVQRAFETMNVSEAQRRTLRQCANPLFYLGRFAAALGVAARETDSFERKVNLMLRQRLNLRGRLTLKEINRITDPFFPDETPGRHPLGGDGLDWEEVAEALGEFRLEWISSARHLGKQNPNHLPLRWQNVNAGLKAQYPMDGNVFSALWRRSK